MIRNDIARSVKLADKRNRQKEYSLSERKAQAEQRNVNRDRLGLPMAKEVVSGKGIISAADGMRSLESRAFSQTKTDAKASEYVWRDIGNGPELVKRERLEYDPALFGLEPITPKPMVQRVARTDGKKVFADYRKARKPVVVVKR